MGKNSAIEWTDHTWNPWIGCHKVSSGCQNCYMYRDQARWGQDPNVVRRAKDATFYAPYHWKEPARVFVCSWSDFFIEEADRWRDEAWDMMTDLKHLTFLLLTKREQRMELNGVPDNIWLGVSAETQWEFDRRVPTLLDAPGQHKFVSIEPLLGPIVVGYPEVWGIDWVIVGGQSGPNARPMNPEWARKIRDDCADYGVPFFFKQMSARGPIPDDLLVRQFPAGMGCGE